MRKLLICIFSLMIAGNLFAQKTDETAIRAVMAKQVTDWNNGNIDAFMETYWKSDSLKFVGSKGVTYGWKNTLERYKKSYPDTTVMGKLQFDIQSVQILSNDYAFVLGKWFLKRTIGDIGGYYTLLFKKVEGKWVIALDHTS
ncbi:DUF4440 domain-containing protein [Danxiaibacter flavus]|uniref:DUF4440 domain-containing protein n=1 Tax=Danxiaibacter flavus TaxID=3049108 RepID=A0ABV3ZQA6_9BACT|nr:DUF4440 domain-containing protein [Chitinophagaceae bacterium DXS]